MGAPSDPAFYRGANPVEGAESNWTRFGADGSVNRQFANPFSGPRSGTPSPGDATMGSGGFGDLPPK